MALPMAVPRVFANVPPMYDATMMPEFRQMGNRENALASLVSSVISPLAGQRLRPRSCGTYMAAFKIAMFPLNRPFRHRAKHICQKVVLKPKATADTADPMQPYTSATLIPISEDSR
jgi:hypothetical protein